MEKNVTQKFIQIVNHQTIFVQYILYQFRGKNLLKKFKTSDKNVKRLNLQKCQINISKRGLCGCLVIETRVKRN